MNRKTIERLDEHIAQLGRKATIISFGDYLGGVNTEHVTIKTVECVKYAQYPETLKLCYTPRNYRNLRCLYYTPDTAFAIFTGWKYPAFEMPKHFRGFDKSLLYATIDSIPERFKLTENTERTKPLNIADVLFQVVGDSTEYFETVDELTAKYSASGVLCDTVRRMELQGMPYLLGLCGPMYNGEQDGRPVIRYETPAVYDSFSR